MDAIIKNGSDFKGSDALSCAFVKNESSLQNPDVVNESNINSNREKEAGNTSEKKSHAVSDNELSLNTKKLLLNNFKQYGCSQETLDKVASTSSLNTQLALDYFKKAAKDAQDFVYQECDSLSFNNVTEWLKYFQEMDGPTECNYEAAVVLNGIANSECHPDPKLMNGINLKAIYRFLSYALLGLPQEQLDAASARFLSNEFQNLIDEANTDEADVDVLEMKRKIEDSLDNISGDKIDSESLSLDPLNIAGWILDSVNK